MKEAEPEVSDPRPTVAAWPHRVPLTVKMVVLTIMTGLIVWLVLDYALTSKLRKMFHTQLTERLGQYAMEDRLSFDRFVKTFQGAVNLFISQKNFIDYVESREWKSDDTYQVIYHTRSPAWFPERSVLRTFTETRYALLLDHSGNTREIYRSRHDTLPPSLLSLNPLLINKSHNQNFMTSIDNNPFILSAKSFFDARGTLRATLLLASPIDDEFLNASLGISRKDHLVALLTSEKEPRILTSSNLEEISAGIPLGSLLDRYLITGKEFFDYGASEMQIKFISFVPLKEVDQLTASVISRARKERAVLALVFILASALMMYWITQNVHQITQNITNFSQHTLGMKQHELPKGDQLHILRERFHRLTKEIISAREIIKRQAEEQTRLIVNNAFDAIITIDEHGFIKTWNPQAEVIFGWSRAEAVGQSIFDTIISSKYREQHDKNIKHFLETGKGPVLNMPIQITALHRLGHEIHVELAMSPAKSGDTYIFIAIIRNITERRKAEQKLKDLNVELARKNKELEQVVYVTSHDLRTPLVNIHGFSRELGASVNDLISVIQSEASPQEIKEKTDSIINKGIIESLTYITRSVTRMNVLLNGLLELSRLGRIELKKGQVDMDRLISDVCGIFRFQTTDAGITLNISELPPCAGDNAQLHQVFSNLIGNAIKFLDPERPGIITVSGHKQNGQSVYCVEDNGIGIAPEHQGMIFELFHQLDPRKNAGEGLGLAIVQKAVERHNGKIWIESEPGRGSRFYVSLPV